MSPSSLTAAAHGWHLRGDLGHPSHRSTQPEPTFTLHRLCLDAPPVQAPERDRWITDRVRSFATSLINHPSTDALVLSGPLDGVRAGLIHLRSQASTRERLIVIDGSQDAWCDALADGPLPSDPMALEHSWQQWCQRLLRLPRGASGLDAESRVARWLWLRPEAWIQPVLDLSDHQLYRYPLLEALLDEPTVHAVTWLERRQRAGVLEAGELVDRLRQCQRCHSSQLNYVDLCPHCHSLDIRREPCLHCFICGHVGSQQAFLHADQMQCPNCYTELRHIGTDYDRPMENLHCQACDAMFLEARVDARCLACGNQQHPADLHVLEIRRFRLSSSGSLSIRHGNPMHDGHHSSLNSSILISSAQFQDAVRWQLSIHREGPSNVSPGTDTQQTSLLALQLIVEQCHRGVKSFQLEQLSDEMIRILPESNRLFQARDDLLWLLRPHSSRADIQELKQHWCTWLTRQGGHGANKLQLRIAAALIPDDLQSSDTPDLLQRRLLKILAESPKVSQPLQA